jgi:hypothetical protein
MPQVAHAPPEFLACLMLATNTMHQLFDQIAVADSISSPHRPTRPW